MGIKNEMKNKQRRPEEHEDSHRWVVSYADFITLLFAFFVVMYAISSVNVSKYKSLSEGMKSAFNKKDQNKATQSTDNKKDGPEEHKTKGTYRDGLDDLNKVLADRQDGSYKINRKDGWIEIEMKAGSLFESGSADITAYALIKIMEIADKIKDLPYPVVVEGYTDNIPITSPQFPSNWELSASRAATVARLLNGFGVVSSRIMVTGYGDQYPVADNNTEEGRNQNRRVTILITKNKKVPRIQNPNFNRIHATAIVISNEN